MSAFSHSAFMPLAEQVLTNILVSNKAPFTGKSKLGLGLLALSGFLLCGATVFAMIGLYGWFLLYHGQSDAAFLIAFTIVLCAIFIGLIGVFLLKRKRRCPAPAAVDVAGLLETLQDALSDELAAPIQDNPKTAMFLSALAGVIAAKYID